MSKHVVYVTSNYKDLSLNGGLFIILFQCINSQRDI